MPQQPCCPTGYTFNPATGFCEAVSSGAIVPNCTCRTSSVNLGPNKTLGDIFNFAGTDCNGNAINFNLAVGQSRIDCTAAPLTITFVSGPRTSLATCLSNGPCYNNAGAISCTSIGTTITAPAIPCPCCPPGYYYWPRYSVCAISDPATSSVIPVDPIPCPCCPTGSTWISFAGTCVLNQYLSLLPAISNIGTTSPIPCLECNCVEPEPAACAPCDSNGTTLSFQYTFQERTCDTCIPVDINPPKGSIQCFMPLQFSDPDTTFILKNLNYI